MTTIASTSNDTAQLERLNEAWAQAIEHKDIDRLMSFVTDDVTFLSAMTPAIRGRSEVRKLYETWLAAYTARLSSHVEETILVGDTAVSWGHEVMTVVEDSTGVSTTLSGYGMAVMKRDRDGAWRFHRAINTLAQRQA